MLCVYKFIHKLSVYHSRVFTKLNKMVFTSQTRLLFLYLPNSNVKNKNKKVCLAGKDHFIVNSFIAYGYLMYATLVAGGAPHWQPYAYVPLVNHLILVCCFSQQYPLVWLIAKLCVITCNRSTTCWVQKWKITSHLRSTLDIHYIMVLPSRKLSKWPSCINK
jgi:hypothetical protein